MSHITWRDDFSVNVQKIDEQHKLLIEMINALHAALKANRAWEAHRTAVDRMIAYAAVHFSTEEKYMQEFGYPGLQEHKAEHERFIAKAEELQRLTNSEGNLVALDMMYFLLDWLRNHILKTDKAYSRCFNEHGLL